MLSPHKALAQSAPDAIFSVSEDNHVGALSTPTTGTWTHSYPGTDSYGSFTNVFTGTATNNDLTLGLSSTDAGSFNLANQNTQAIATYYYSVYVKGHPTVTIVTAGNSSANITGGGTASVDNPKTSTDISLDVTHGSDSDSNTFTSTSFINIGCNGANSSGGTTFSGTSYVIPTGFSSIAAQTRVTSNSSHASSSYTLSASMGATVTVTLGSDAPIPTLGGPKVSGVVKAYPDLGDSITIANLSYDPDNANGTTALEGICAAAWSVTFPNGTVQNSSSTGSVNFTATIPGEYLVNLLVTDNEGATASTSTTVSVQERNASTSEDDGPQECIADSNEKVCGRLDTASGRGTALFHDPVSTRGYPLTNNVYIRSQTWLPGHTTKMGNAVFTYGMEVLQASVTKRGVASNRWILVDADGTEIDFGPTSSSPAAQTGTFATLATNVGGYLLSNAGAPGSVQQGGNYSYQFDTNGKLTDVTDPSNNVQQITYDMNGDPTVVTDLSSSRTIEFEYDTPGEIARLVEGSGEVVNHFTYSSGKLTEIEVKDSLGTTIRDVTFGYDLSGRLSTLTQDGDAASAITFSYQNAGSGISVANMTYAGGASNLDYFTVPGTGAKYRTVKTTDGGGQILYDFDANQDLIKITLPIMHGASVAAKRTLTRHASRKVNLLTDYDAVTYAHTYDSLGNVTKIRRNGTDDWNFTYNGFDLLTAADPIGTYLTLAYTDVSNPHSPTSFTDAGSRTWTKTYNAYGQVLTVVPPVGSSIGTTTYTYEESSTSHPNYGYLTSITNGASDVTTLDAYSPLGDVLSRTTSPVGGTNHTTTYTFDADRRLTSITNPDSTVYSLAYTGRNLTSTLDEAGTQYDYDWKPASGQLESITGPLSHELQWDYNDDRQLSTFTDARTNATSYTYGLAGELTFATYPDTSATEYEYNSKGQLLKTTTPRARVSSYAYDPNGLLQTVTFTNPSQTQLQFTYLDDNTLSTARCYTGLTTYTYTSAREINTYEYNYGNSNLSNRQYVIHTYNPDGTVATLQWKNGSTSVVTWTYTYDGAGRMTGVSNTFGESSTFTYDHEGKIKTQTNANGTTTDYAYYEPRGWISSITHKLSGTAFASYALTYDSSANTVGNMTGVTELDGTTVAYGYDALYRLTSETRSGTNSFSHTYDYDLAGNVTDLDGSSFASYDAANKISSLSGGTFSYDADGDLTAINGAGLSSGTFSYETRNLLDNQTQSSTTLSYNYDVFGKRVLRKPSATTSTHTWYVFDGDRLIGEVGTGGVKVAYTWGADGIVSERVISGNKSLYYHFGPQGETRQLTNSAGAVVDTYLYTAYGVPVTSTGSNTNALRYGGKVGYYTDGPLGLILATYRWYSPNLMRWMTRDPIEYAGGENMNAYVAGNPVRFVDPAGQEGLEILGTAFRSAAGAPSIAEGIPVAAFYAGYYIGKAIENKNHKQLSEFFHGPSEPDQCSFDPKLEMGKPRQNWGSKCKNACAMASNGDYTTAQITFCNELLTPALRESCRSAMARANYSEQECRGWCDEMFPPRKPFYIH